MQTQLARWGDSLGLRIPEEMAGRLGLTDRSRVDVVLDGDRIVITSERPRYKLEDMLSGMTPEAMREAFDWGPDAGREKIDE